MEVKNMNQYVTGTVIRELREKNKMTQLQLAEKLGVSDKTVSKWETGKGYPDITLLEPIAEVFKISVTELISGNTVHNANVPANMLRSKFYVCDFGNGTDFRQYRSQCKCVCQYAEVKILCLSGVRQCHTQYG